MKQVLFVAYYFPPAGGSGVQRTLKFVRYLPKHGWQSVVLTAPPPKRLQDESMLQELLPSIPIVRSPALLPPSWLPWRVRNWIARWILVVDEQLGWLPFALRAAQKIVSAPGVKAIYTTSAPYTAHLVGLRLQAKTGLPWIADFRDPWIGNFSARFPTRFHESLARSLERKIIAHADRVLVVSEPMRQAMIARLGQQYAPHIIVIPNGYDSADFAGQIPAERPADKFTIVYSGSFYGQRQTPKYFFEAVRIALDSGLLAPERLLLRFVGNTGVTLLPLAKQFGLDGFIENTGYLPHRQSISHLLAADLLLLVIGSGPGSEAVYTGKIFEYLAARRPILCLAGPGAAAELTAQARAGWVIHPEKPPHIAAELGRLFQEWQSNSLSVHPDETIVARYDRQKQAAKLAGILDAI